MGGSSQPEAVTNSPPLMEKDSVRGEAERSTLWGAWRRGSEEKGSEEERRRGRGEERRGVRWQRRHTLTVTVVPSSSESSEPVQTRQGHVSGRGGDVSRSGPRALRAWEAARDEGAVPARVVPCEELRHGGGASVWRSEGGEGSGRGRRLGRRRSAHVAAVAAHRPSLAPGVGEEVGVRVRDANVQAEPVVALRLADRPREGALPSLRRVHELNAGGANHDGARVAAAGACRNHAAPDAHVVPVLPEGRQNLLGGLIGKLCLRVALETPVEGLGDLLRLAVGGAGGRGGGRRPRGGGGVARSVYWSRVGRGVHRRTIL